MYIHIYVSTCVYICTYIYSCNGTKMRQKNVKCPFFILRTIIAPYFYACSLLTGSNVDYLQVRKIRK